MKTTQLIKYCGKNVNKLDSELVTAAAEDASKLKAWKGYKASSSHSSGRQLNSGLDTNSLPAYIRNYIHHPEFTDINNVIDNTAYTDEELRNSIKFMIELL